MSEHDDKSCPFCGRDNLNDKGFGILCRTCGAWVGEGSASLKFGGYKKLWNTRLYQQEAHEIHK